MIDATVAPKVGFINPFGTTICNVNHSNARYQGITIAKAVSYQEKGNVILGIVSNGLFFEQFGLTID
jgi:hypothetical protein